MRYRSPALCLRAELLRSGADLLCDTFFARMERGGGLPSPIKLPYFPDQARQLTQRYEFVIVAGTRRPVAFFGQPGVPSHLTTEEQTVILTGPQEDTVGALAALAREVNAPDVIDQVLGALPVMPKGALGAQSVSAVIARLQPLDCIVMDEVLAVGVPVFRCVEAFTSIYPSYADRRRHWPRPERGDWRRHRLS